MPGTICNGDGTTKPLIQESRAYCEGMLYRAGGTGAGAPITDNPYTATARPVEKTAWDAGWTEANNAAGGTITAAAAGCCAARGLSVSV